MTLSFCNDFICLCNTPMVHKYGLWDDIRVDHGKEWQLMLFIQEKLAHQHTTCSKSPNNIQIGNTTM